MESPDCMGLSRIGFLNLPHHWQLYLESLFVGGGNGDGGSEGAGLYIASAGPLQCLKCLLAWISGSGKIIFR